MTTGPLPSDLIVGVTDAILESVLVDHPEVSYPHATADALVRVAIDALTRQWIAYRDIGS